MKFDLKAIMFAAALAGIAEAGYQWVVESMIYKHSSIPEDPWKEAGVVQID